MPDHTLITNLFNYTLPLIRYRMADVLRAVDPGEHAPYLVIESLVGRNELQPVFRNRNGIEDFISPHTINEIFVAGVTRFQLELTGETDFRFMIVLDAALVGGGAHGRERRGRRAAARDPGAQAHGQCALRGRADRRSAREPAHAQVSADRGPARGLNAG